MLATNSQFVQWILKVKSNIDSGTFRPMVFFILLLFVDLNPSDLFVIVLLNDCLL